MSYLLKYKQESQPVSFSSNEIQAHWITIGLNYLKKKLVWFHPEKRVRIVENDENNPIVETQNPIGNPIGIRCK